LDPLKPEIFGEKLRDLGFSKKGREEKEQQGGID